MREPGRAHVLVIGNEKGGSGKSTTALHIAVSLMSDGAQGGDDRSRRPPGHADALPREPRRLSSSARASSCRCRCTPRSMAIGRLRPDEKARFEAALEPAVLGADFVVIDTPGSDTHLSRLAHTWADTLLTPLNDSFIDLDLLARVDPETLKVVRPSIYAEAVWKQRQIRSMQGARPVDWIVMRNRLSSLAARNKRDMAHGDRGAGQAHRLPRRRGPQRARDLSRAVPERPDPARPQARRRRRRPVADHEPCRGPPGSARPRGGAQSATARCSRTIGRPGDSRAHTSDRRLQDEQGAERPGVAVRRVAGRGARPQVDDFAHRPLAGEDHQEDREVAGGGDAAGIVVREGRHHQRHVLDRQGAEEAEQHPHQDRVGRRQRRRSSRRSR